MKKNKKKEVSEEMLMKTVKKMSLQNCVLWSNKIENHIGSLREMIQKRQSIVISAPEEIAYRNKWIDKALLLESASRYGKSPYGAHLMAVADGKIWY